jgi:hypothetical protein
LENQNIKHEKFLILMAFALSSCAELQQIANHPTLGTIGGLDVEGWITRALNNGITKQVTKLALRQMVFRNEAVKILLPEELRR